MEILIALSFLLGVVCGVIGSFLVAQYLADRNWRM